MDWPLCSFASFCPLGFCQCKISYLFSIHTQSHGRVLTRRIRQHRPIAMPSRGRLSVHDEQYYSFRTRILHPGKAQRELPAIIKHYAYIGGTPHTGVDTHTPSLAVRHSSTTSSYAHYTTPRVEYTLVRYGSIAVSYTHLTLPTNSSV